MKEESFTIITGMGINSKMHHNINIKGKLDGILIDANKPVTIKIFLKEFPSIVLYEKKLFMGQKYLPLRKEAIYPDADVSEFPVKWVLNDNVEFLVSNNMEAKVKFKVRFNG